MKNVILYKLIAEELKRVEKKMLEVIQTPVEVLNDIGVHLTKAGGKRLRPALYLLCARQGKEKSADPIATAAALELIHMATLVHDDVIDRAETRRGIPTAHTKWGNNPSVLAGDFLFAKAFTLVAMQNNARLITVMADIISTMCEGEVAQNQEMFNAEQTEEGYYLRIRQKTADFIAGSMYCGAITAKLPESEAQALRQYGHSIGMAFQITDDILDFTASSEQLGKPSVSDLRHGIITLPVIHAMNNSSRGSQLREIIRQGAINDAELDTCLSIIEEADSLEYAYKQVDRYLKEACDALPMTLDKTMISALHQIAERIGKRTY